MIQFPWDGNDVRELFINTMSKEIILHREIKEETKDLLSKVRQF